MAEFYYRSGPNEYGPLTASELHKLAQVGRLMAADEVRRGRQGKWILAANLPGLFTLPGRREELAINEMDVVAYLPEPTSTEHGPAQQSDRETAVDEIAAENALAGSRSGPPDAAPEPTPAGEFKGLLMHWAVAVVVVCHFAAVLGLVLGIASLFGEQSLLQRIYAGVCFLFSLVGLVGGCCVSLLGGLRPRPPRS